MAPEDPPLSHLLPPGEYQVEWEVPDRAAGTRRLSGGITLEGNRPPTGYARGDVPTIWDRDGAHKSAGFPQSYTAESVTGTLLNGFTVVLIDVHIEIFPSVASLNARVALVGRDTYAGGGPNITAFRTQLSGLDAVAGTPPIRSVTHPRSLREAPTPQVGEGAAEASSVPSGPTWTVSYNRASTQHWADSGADVELRFLSAATAADAFFFRVHFSPVLDVTLREPVSIDSVVQDWVEPFRGISSLSTGRQERITFLTISVEASDADSTQHVFQVYGRGLHQDPYATQPNDVRKLQPSFTLSGDSLSLVQMARTWQGLEDSGHPLLQTYGSMMFAPQQHPRSQFVMLVQALEGLQGYADRANSEARKIEHQAARAAVLIEAKETLSGAALRFVKKHLLRTPPESLDGKLRLALAALPVDISSALDHSALIATVRSEAKPSSVYDALRMVRNHLSHGTRSYDTLQLHEVSQLLERAARAYLLRLLGCPDSVLEREQSRDD